MRKATKRVEEEAVDTASTPDASPPKARMRETKEVAPMQVRLPRAAKTKALALVLRNHNDVDIPAETMKKSRAPAELASKKSNSTENLSPKSFELVKKSRSAEDVNPKGREPPAKSGKAVAARKPAPKMAGSTAEAKPTRGTKNDEEHKSEEAEEDKESEDIESKETTQRPTRKTSGKVAAKIPVVHEADQKEVPKKRATAAKKTTRGRGKASAAVDEEEEQDGAEDKETEDVIEKVKPAKGTKDKGIEKAKHLKNT